MTPGPVAWTPTMMSVPWPAPSTLASVQVNCCPLRVHGPPELKPTLQLSICTGPPNVLVTVTLVALSRLGRTDDDAGRTYTVRLTPPAAERPQRLHGAVLIAKRLHGEAGAAEFCAADHDIGAIERSRIAASTKRSQVLRRAVG